MRGRYSHCTVKCPGDLSEALETLAAEPGRWRPLAGGTDLMVVLAAGKLADSAFLDLSRIEALRGITETERGFRVGAACTFTELRECAAIHRHLPNLVKSAKATGALAIQNRGTWGGNIANASPAADTPPSLLAYGAELELVSLRGTRRVAYEAFHLDYKRMDLATDELIAAVHVPKPEGRSFHYFRKVGTRQAQAISKVCLAACATLEEGRIRELRLGLGAVAPVPLRARRTEALLRGAALSALPLAEARALLGEEISPIDDIRSSAHYRRTVAANLLESCLRQMAGAQSA